MQLGLADLDPPWRARKLRLELARRYAAMEKVVGLVVALPPPHGKNAIPTLTSSSIASEARDRERNAQGLRLVAVSQQLDIVGRIARLRPFAAPVRALGGRPKG